MRSRSRRQKRFPNENINDHWLPYKNASHPLLRRGFNRLLDVGDRVPLALLRLPLQK